MVVASEDAEGRTPRSIALSANENRVMRMPDSNLMFKQQRSLQDMLSDIYEDPNGFQVGDPYSVFLAL